MLRVTTLDDQPACVTLKVEGRIGSESTDTLDRTCHGYLEEGKAILLDLAEVTFIDQCGAELLRALQAHPVYLTDVPPLIRAAIAENDTP